MLGVEGSQLFPLIDDFSDGLLISYVAHGHLVQHEQAAQVTHDYIWTSHHIFQPAREPITPEKKKDMIFQHTFFGG